MVQQGHFLPWHRYFLIAYENALRHECGYKGAQPYWNWTLDSGPGKDVRDSPLFDPVTGLGGNGQPGVPLPPPRDTRVDMPGGTGGGCVLDGPFVKLTCNVGPGDSLTYSPRCLSRSFNPTMAIYMNYSNIEPLADATTFKQFDFIAEATPSSPDEPLSGAFKTSHAAAHLFIGGEETDAYSSNCEPIFYLHHAYIDALWLAWQSADPSGSRFFDISGPQKPFSKEPQVTLDFPIELGEEGVPIPISSVMDPRKGNRGGIACYEYEYDFKW